MRRIFVLAILVFLLLPFLAAASPVGASGDCQYVLGFKALHDAMPNVVGECLTNEYHNAQNGDGLQRTTRGLLVWRKADNSIAFTDGYQTWVDGPNGMRSRLNSQRFPWEHDADISHPDHSGLGTPMPSDPGTGAWTSNLPHDGVPGMHH